jgi:glycosyltransferase involved in cell wall biosynthesis
VRTLVAIPVYNHAGVVRAVAARALAGGHRVLVVDDGSTDGSLEAVAGLEVHTLRLPVNRGKGAAILAAAREAERLGCQVLVTLDADGQHRPEETGRLLAAAPGPEPALVVGARAMDPGRTPVLSRFGRSFSNFWVWVECGQRLPDTQSGYRLYPVSFLLGRRFLSRRYTFEVEVLVRAAWAGLALRSVPISVHYPPGRERISHFGKFRDNLRLAGLHTLLVTGAILRRLGIPLGA